MPDVQTLTDRCSANQTRHAYLGQCAEFATFVVGLPGTDPAEWRSACTQHLAKVVHAQIERLKPEPRSILVAPVDR
ncbi:hypothetical protein ACIBCH_20690 [Amycolatopsis thailandensis]|uniref:hypothetical protein n=1 Tax=Amycolatopsis thailandensis TaxID=589330 RepID=UPI003788F70F